MPDDHDTCLKMPPAQFNPFEPLLSQCSDRWIRGTRVCFETGRIQEIVTHANRLEQVRILDLQIKTFFGREFKTTRKLPSESIDCRLLIRCDVTSLQC